MCFIIVRLVDVIVLLLLVPSWFYNLLRFRS